MVISFKAAPVSLLLGLITFTMLLKTTDCLNCSTCASSKAFSGQQFGLSDPKNRPLDCSQQETVFCEPNLERIPACHTVSVHRNGHFVTGKGCVSLDDEREIDLTASYFCRPVPYEKVLPNFVYR